MTDPPDALPTSEHLTGGASRSFHCAVCGAEITQEFGCKHWAPLAMRRVDTEAAALEVVIRAKAQELEQQQERAIIQRLASGGNAAIRDAVEKLSVHHIDCAVNDSERGPCDCGTEKATTTILAGLTAIAAQRAAEAARVRELEETEALVLRWGKAFDAMEVTLYDNVGDFASITEEWQAANKAMRDYWAIRALREAPRG